MDCQEYTVLEVSKDYLRTVRDKVSHDCIRELRLLYPLHGYVQITTSAPVLSFPANTFNTIHFDHRGPAVEKKQPLHVRLEGDCRHYRYERIMTFPVGYEQTYAGRRIYDEQYERVARTCCDSLVTDIVDHLITYKGKKCVVQFNTTTMVGIEKEKQQDMIASFVFNYRIITLPEDTLINDTTKIYFADK